jgi:hypothetical protein
MYALYLSSGDTKRKTTSRIKSQRDYCVCCGSYLSMCDLLILSTHESVHQGLKFSFTPN